MKPTTGDGENESRETQWPSVPKIASADEFQQCLAVARLAVKLCELQKRELQNKWEAEDRKYAHDIQTAVTESEKKQVNEQRNKQLDLRIRTLDPEGFVSSAWQLIEKARKHVLREQTNDEFLAAHHDGSHEAAEMVVGRIRQDSQVLFERLCNPNRNKGDTETIHGVRWKVFTTERGFDDLFWAYWSECGKYWKNADLAKNNLDHNSYDERVVMAKLVSDPAVWKERGEAFLNLWKRDGVPPNDFLGLARFRSERDNRVANLENKPKQKLRRKLKAQ